VFVVLLTIKCCFCVNFCFLLCSYCDLLSVLQFQAKR